MNNHTLGVYLFFVVNDFSELLSHEFISSSKDSVFAFDSEFLWSFVHDYTLLFYEILQTFLRDNNLDSTKHFCMIWIYFLFYMNEDNRAIVIAIISWCYSL